MTLNKTKQITKRQFIKSLGIIGLFFSFGGFFSLFNKSPKSSSTTKSGFGNNGYGA
ncbi:MAG: hypothetical protein H7196_04850 [candidate division SR1 bacterium]|nr:hypothetical protein [candidate division SR1 bacterium]